MSMSEESCEQLSSLLVRFLLRLPLRFGWQQLLRAVELQEAELVARSHALDAEAHALRDECAAERREREHYGEAARRVGRREGFAQRLEALARVAQRRHRVRAVVAGEQHRSHRTENSREYEPEGHLLRDVTHLVAHRTRSLQTNAGAGEGTGCSRVRGGGIWRRRAVIGETDAAQK